MANLKLPEINPIQVDLGAERFDRAGAQFNQAMGQTANVFAELDKATIIARSHQAALAADQGLDKFTDLQKRNPTLGFSEAAQLFGQDDVPPEVFERFRAPGTKDVNPDTQVPFHELAPHVFKYMARKSREDAAKGIEGIGWQTKFLAAREQDDLQRLQAVKAEAFAAQNAVNTTVLLDAAEQHIQRGNPAAAEAAINAIPNPAVRAKGLLDLPARVRDRDLAANLNPPGTFDEQSAALTAQRAQIEANAFDKKMDDKERMQWLGAYDAKIAHVEKQRYQAEYQATAAPLVYAANLPPDQQREHLINNPFFLPKDSRLTQEDAKRLLDWRDQMLKGENQQNDAAEYARLRENDDRALMAMSLAEVQALRGRFTDPTYQKLVDIRQRGTGSRFKIPEDARGWMADVLEERKFDKKKDPIEYNNAWFRLAAAYDERVARQGTNVSPDDIRADGVRLFKQSEKTEVGDLGRLEERGFRTVISQLRQSQGRPAARENEYRVQIPRIRAASKDIKAAWEQMAPENPDIEDTQIAQIFYEVDPVENPLGRQEVERQMRADFVKDGRRPPDKFTDAQAYAYVIARDHATTESQTKAKQVAAAAEMEAQNKAANARAEALGISDERLARIAGVSKLPPVEGLADEIKAAVEAERKAPYIIDPTRSGGATIKNPAVARVLAKYKPQLDAVREADAAPAREQAAKDQAAYAEYAAKWKREHPPEVVMGVEMRNDPMTFEAWKKARK